MWEEVYRFSNPLSSRRFTMKFSIVKVLCCFPMEECYLKNFTDSELICYPSAVWCWHRYELLDPCYWYFIQSLLLQNISDLKESLVMPLICFAIKKGDLESLSKILQHLVRGHTLLNICLCQGEEFWRLNRLMFRSLWDILTNGGWFLRNFGNYAFTFMERVYQLWYFLLFYW